MYMRVENTSGGGIPFAADWTLGGGAWRILNTNRYDKSLRHYIEGDPSGNNQLIDVNHLQNSTTFRIGGSNTDRMESGDVLGIIAVLA